MRVCRNVGDFVFEGSEKIGDREHPFLVNDLSAYLDLTQVYGSDLDTESHLRSGKLFSSFPVKGFTRRSNYGVKTAYCDQ